MMYFNFTITLNIVIPAVARIFNNKIHKIDCFVVPPRNDENELRHCERSEAIFI